jgi:hypothetical protein
MRLRSRFVRVVAMATLAVGAVACTPQLDTAGLEATLKDQVSAETGATITKVDCPDAKAEAGNVFRCTATDDEGVTLTLKVTQTNDSGDVVYAYEDADAPGSASPTP